MDSSRMAKPYRYSYERLMETKAFYHSEVTRIRMSYHRNLRLDESDNLIVRTRSKERRILSGKWWVNRNTPVGEDAELIERKAFGGRRYLDWGDIVAVERLVTDKGVLYRLHLRKQTLELKPT